MRKIPSNLQGILWSASVDTLDLEHDKNYIIHQVLRYGTLAHLRWLFKAYSKEELRKVFIEHPVKVYSKSALNFAKIFLLNLKNTHLNESYYLASSPRRITGRSIRH